MAKIKMSYTVQNELQKQYDDETHNIYINCLNILPLEIYNWTLKNVKATNPYTYISSMTKDEALLAYLFLYESYEDSK